MRISLLLQREPFGAIIEETLSQFLSDFVGGEFIVTWHDNVIRKGERKPEQQIWLCNIYLNAIFTPDVKMDTLSPLRREFGYSRVWHRRPFQRLYTELAGWKISSRLLAQKSMRVNPPLAASEHFVFVGGNHKLRLLDNAQGIVHSILKSGFSPKYIQNEIQTRQTAYELGIPVPKLTCIKSNGYWFSERLITGTPANRLRTNTSKKQVYDYAIKKLEILLGETAYNVRLGCYIDSIVKRISQLINANSLLHEKDKQDIMQIAVELILRLEAESVIDMEWTLAHTHGDFQPANILASADKVWLIDWEYSSQRQINYDLLVLGLSSRFPHRFAERLNRFVDTEEISAVSSNRWKSDFRRYISALIFCLEEILFHLEENSNPRFIHLSGGLFPLLYEIKQWLTYPKTVNYETNQHRIF